ncbi:hypothetical protein [Kocuria sp. U4B]
MTISAPKALAVELRPSSPTHWVAIYYPMVDTPAGRWADVTWELHQRLIAVPVDSRQPARWLDLRSPDPDHPGYAAHQAWAHQLAAGYTAALAVHQAEATEEPLPLQEAQRMRDTSVVVPAGQLSEWVLDDLEVGTPGLYG